MAINSLLLKNNIYQVYQKQDFMGVFGKLYRNMKMCFGFEKSEKKNIFSGKKYVKLKETFLEEEIEMEKVVEERIILENEGAEIFWMEFQKKKETKRMIRKLVNEIIFVSVIIAEY